LLPGGAAASAPAPLAIVGGVTLRERALATAQAAAIRRYVVVVGSLDGPVRSFCRRRRPDVEVVSAPDHARGNGATVVAGLAHAGGRCLVMMVDHLHEPSTLERVLAADGELVFAVDSRPAYVDPDDATLVRLEHGAVVAIDKRLASYDAIEAGLAACSAARGARRDAARRARVQSAQRRVARRRPPDRHSGHRRRLLADIDTLDERRRAIRHLVDRFGAKRTDGPVARVLNRPLSSLVSRRLLATRIGPNPSRSRTSACSCCPACYWRLEPGRTCC
jgi:choline kinase